MLCEAEGWHDEAVRRAAPTLFCLLVGACLLLGPLPGALAAGEARHPLAQAPPELREAAAPALAAFQELKRTLEARLQRSFQEGGPVAAISVCRLEAPALTREVGAGAGMELGRTSHRLRNPDNAPRPWVRPYLARHAGQLARDLSPEVVELPGGRLGVLAPIGIQPQCLTCHGPRAAMAAPLAEALKSRYPQDQATGFRPGELRGVFWAELAR